MLAAEASVGDVDEKNDGKDVGEVEKEEGVDAVQEGEDEEYMSGDGDRGPLLLLLLIREN